MEGDVERTVADVLLTNYSISGGCVSRDSRLVEDLGLDSMGLVELVMTLNEELRIELPETEVAKWETVKDIICSAALACKACTSF